MIKNFEDLWKAHFDWNLDVLLKKIRPLKTADIYIGYTSDEWFNFALPKVKNPSGLNLEEIKKVLTPNSPPTTVYLLEKHVKSGFLKFLLQNSYEFYAEDNYAVFNPSFKDLETEVQVERIGLNKFPDYEKVTIEVYEEDWDFDNRIYDDICRKTLTGEIKSKVPSFSSEFFMVYENGKPAAGAGLFLTDELGYFHNDATYKKYRRKGYHNALIKERIKFCLNKGVKTLYAIIDGIPSLKSFSKCGFEVWQVAKLFTLKKDQ